MRCALVACVVLAAAALSALVAAPAPAYDPTAWLLWGREITEWRLSTAEGPAFKPLAVAVAVALAPTGSAAPWLLVVLARAAAFAALPLAFVVARRLANGSVAAGLLGAAGVALCAGAIALGAAGMTEGAVLALAWRRGWVDRRVLGVVAVGVPLAWFVPELAGSGDALRSGVRARISEPGQPARADVPLLASARDAVALVPWPLWLGAAAVLVHRPWRGAVVPAALGAGWIALVALMAQAGFSGEARYALPGAGLVAVSGAAGLALLARALPRVATPPATAAAAALVLLAALPAIRDAGRVPARQEHAHALQRDLAALVRAQGRTRILACGDPYTGRLRGPMLAYALDVHRRTVEPDDPPRAPGVVFRSALRKGGPVVPDPPPGWTVAGRLGEWEMRRSCRSS